MQVTFHIFIMKKNLSNKRILIIGSSRGIGFEIAKYLHNHNSKVIISSLEKDNIFGTQFHPEKSDKDGLKLIENFISL